MASALLWLACGKGSQDVDGALSRESLETKILQTTSGGQWSFTGSLATPRSGHTATLLPSGEVLVAGGWGSDSERLSSAEAYDTATGAWSPTGPLATARVGHTATLLPSGKVLVAGGGDATTHLLTLTEVYEDAGIRQEWRPIITQPAKQQRSQTFHVTGSHLRGLSEASSGNARGSATNFPLVSLLALEGGTLTRVASEDLFSDTEVTVQMPSVPDGYYILSVMVNAIHGGQMLFVDGPPIAAPKITSPEAFVNTPKPVIAGTAESGRTVLVRLDGAVAGTTSATAQGQWSFTPVTALADGLHRVVAVATDEGGNVSLDSEERSFAVDTVPPAAPVVMTPGSFISTNTPVIAGTAEPGSTIKVWLDNDETTTETLNVGTEGDWRFITRTALDLGYHTVSAIATDEAGNPSDPSKHRFAFQKSHYGWSCTTAPTIAVIWTLRHWPYSSAGANA